jgi:predicted SprT family Zn-dependent metalloprotease
MNLFTARYLARDLMHHHGLHDWQFRFDHAKRRFGSCRYKSRLITLSRHLTFLNEESQVRDTLLHEIAHALTPGDGHGQRWKATCRTLGANPRRCYTEKEVVSPPRRPAPYRLGCPRCNWWIDRHRRPDPRRKFLCRHCRASLVFQRAGDAHAQREMRNAEVR